MGVEGEIEDPIKDVEFQWDFWAFEGENREGDLGWSPFNLRF